MTHFTICVSEDQTIDRLDLKLGGSVSYYPSFLSEAEHLQLLKHLTSDIHWYEYTGAMGDKVVTYPRLMYNMSGDDYTWTPLVNSIRQRLQKLTKRTFSYAHLGYYKTGDRYLGYHCDKELHDGDIICSVTLGATRRFVIRERYLKSGRTRNSGPPEYEFMLKGGSYLTRLQPETLINIQCQRSESVMDIMINMVWEELILPFGKDKTDSVP